MVRLSLLWGLGLVLIPLIALQGWWVRRKALRLGPADGPKTGTVTVFEASNDASSALTGAAPSGARAREPSGARLLGLGDSVIAGVGIENTALSLVPQVALRWCPDTVSHVEWRIRAEDGATLNDVIRLLNDGVEGQFDVVIISVGVNDVTRLTPLVKWQSLLMLLIARLREHSPDATLVFLMVPPMDRFPMLPQPLRAMLGIRAAMLNRVLGWVIGAHHGVIGVDLATEFDASLLATDGYHPNARAIEEIADVIVAAL